MSTLIPTPRTDKNGRTVIRHMKAEGMSGRKDSSIPKVASSISPKVSVKDILETISTHKTSDWITELAKPVRLQAARIIERDMPESVALVDHLLNTGNETSRRLVSDAFDFAVSHIANVLNSRSSGKDAVSVPDHTRENLISTMRSAWNFGNVIEELGYTDEDRVGFYYGRYKNVVDKEVKQLYDKRFSRLKASDSYWRGIASFTVTDIEDYSPEGYENAHKFIQWAGKHDDIAYVTNLAIERKTLIVDELQAVMDAGKDTDALRDGAL